MMRAGQEERGLSAASVRNSGSRPLPGARFGVCVFCGEPLQPKNFTLMCLLPLVFVVYPLCFYLMALAPSYEMGPRPDSERAP